MKRSDFLFLLFISLVGLYLLLPLSFTGLSSPPNDQAQHYWPQRHYSKEQLIKGKLPLWNPYIFAGVPHLANPQAAVFYPLSILFYLFPLPKVFFWFVWIHLSFLGMFFYLFLRRQQYSFPVSCFLTVSLMFSSFIFYQIPAGHSVSLSGYPWIFLILLFLPGNPEKVVFLVLAIVFLYLSGHLQIFFIGLLLAFIYLLVDNFSRAKYFLLATVLAIFLVAFQMLPSWEFISQTTKLSWSALAEKYSLELKSFKTLFLPMRNIEIASYLFEKYNLYFGILPFLLFIFTLSLARCRQKLFSLILIVVGLLISFGPNLFFYRWLFKTPLTYFRVPARFYFLTLVGILLLLGENIRQRTELQKFLPILTLLTLFDLSLWQRNLLKPLSLPPAGSIQFARQNVRIFTDEELFINKSVMLHQFNLNGYDALIPNYFIQNHYQAVLSGVPLKEKRIFPVTYLAVNKLTDFSHPLLQQWGVNYFLTTRRYRDSKINPVQQKDIFIYPLSDRQQFFITEQVFSVDDLLEYLLLDKIDKPAEKICYVLNVDANLPKFSNGRVFSRKLEIFPEKIIWEGEIIGFIWLVFAEQFYPGWQTYIFQNNQWKKIPVYRGNRVLRVLAIDARLSPVQKIVQIYHPVSFYFGLVVSTLTFAGLSIYFFFSNSKYLLTVN